MTPSQIVFVIAMTLLGISAAFGLLSIIAFIIGTKDDPIAHIEEE